MRRGKFKPSAVVKRPQVVVKMQQPSVDSPIAERMANSEGLEMLAVMKTFQHNFGARLLWFKDGEGELGKRPGWCE